MRCCTVKVADLKPAEQKSLRTWAEAGLAEAGQAKKDFKVRPESWKERKISGLPALSLIADYTGEKRKMVGYYTYVRGQIDRAEVRHLGAAGAIRRVPQAVRHDRRQPESEIAVSAKHRTTAGGTGYGSGLWPVLLSLLVVLIPTACVLWFLNEAVQNERLAARQRLAEAYRGYLPMLRNRLDAYWQQQAAALDATAGKSPGSGRLRRLRGRRAGR